MAELPKYYTLLFNAAEDAVKLLHLREYAQARDRLIKGMRDAEDAYIDSEDFGNVPLPPEDEAEY